MISPPDNPPIRRRLLWKVAVIAACVCVAFAAALVLRKSSPHAAAPPVPLTATQVLAGMPTPGEKSAASRVVGAALAKVRAKEQDAVVWVDLGDALAQLLRDTSDETLYDHAAAAYQFALRLQPRSADAMIGLAWVSGGRHLFAESREWANRALAIDAGNAAANGILGDADVELGDYDLAYKHYQEMMDRKPDLSSWSRGAHLLDLTGDTKKAIWLMEKAIKAGAPFAENSAWCRAKLAMMLFKQGAYISAGQILEPPLKSGSKNVHVLLAAGRIAAAREDFPAAEKYWTDIVTLAPNHEALASLGDLCAATGKPEAAQAYYARVEALEKAQFTRVGHSHMAMAKFYADHDINLIEALRMAEARKLTKNVNEADTLAWAYYKNGDAPHAIEAIKRALSQKTQDAEIQYHAGMIAAKFGDRVSAQNHLQSALSLSPRFSILQAPIAVATLARLGSAPANAEARAVTVEGSP